MDNTGNKKQVNTKRINRLVNLAAALLFIAFGLFAVFIHDIPYPALHAGLYCPQPDSNGNFTDAARIAFLERSKDTVVYWAAPELSSLDADPEKELIMYGRDLVVHTAAYYGREGIIFKSSTNGMNCQNCHLEAGTKVYGNNFAAVSSTYPKYRARSGRMESIYKRVNDCFERSLNGKTIDTASREMQAIFSYIKWLGKDVAKGNRPAGSGTKDLPFLDRAADVKKGELVYQAKCIRCHNSNGEGKWVSATAMFTYPPLWGKQSYNTGAGLYRLTNFAKFVKCNMPDGATHKSAQLSDEEAWDVAAFVNSQEHPLMNIQKDWPDINEKPYDHPFGPYTDGFSEQQHKYGPFRPVIEKQEERKKFAKK